MRAFLAKVSSLFEGRAYFLLLSRRFVLLWVSLGLNKLRVSSKVGPILFLCFVFIFSAMVNIMRITRSADRKAGGSANPSEGGMPRVEQSTSGGNL